MKLRFIARDRSSYVGPVVSFSAVGDVKEVSGEEASRLLSTFPDWFQDAGSDDSSDDESEDSEDSEVLAPDSNGSGANLSDTQLEILTIVKNSAPIKIGAIGSEMNVAWQSIRSDVDLLVTEKLILKDYENKYSPIA